MKAFGGRVLFLDRNDINTDEIIPAKYLTENSKKALAPYLLEDLKLPAFTPSRDIPGKAAVVTRANFGCGSSREHAPWALEMNGIHLVVAESFARIFRQNMYNCGMLAIELPADTLASLFATFAATGADVAVDLDKCELSFSAASGSAASGGSGGKKQTVLFSLSAFERALVEAGGWVEYAAKHY